MRRCCSLRYAGPPDRSALPGVNPATRRQAMAFKLNHVHLKSEDPKKTADFYINNLGATLMAEIGTRGYRVNLHGLTLNITTIVADQKRQQLYGMEHFAIDTDDLDGTISKLQ